MNTISITTSQNIELEYDLASLGDRLLARILDGLVIFAYVVILSILLFIGRGGVEKFQWLMLAAYLPILFYDLLSEIFLNGQSAGKKMMGIKVISLSGEQPSLGQYLIRWVFRLVDFVLTVQLLALIMVAVTEKKQRLGDLIAGTTLVKTKPRTHFIDTLYVDTPVMEYKVIYPEVINLKDADIQLVKEVLIAVHRSGNNMLALQAQQKIEQVLQIRSQQAEPMWFLQSILSDYNYLTSRM